MHICLFAYRSQALVQKSQFRNQVTFAAWIELRSGIHSHLFGKAVYRSYQLDFIDREAEILQNTVRRQRIDMNYCLAHGIPQLEIEEEI